MAAAALLAIDVAGMRFFDLPVVRLLGQDTQMAIGQPPAAAFIPRQRMERADMAVALARPRLALLLLIASFVAMIVTRSPIWFDATT